MRTNLTPAEDGSTPGCGIAIMAKASIRGRSKTRLVPPLSFEEAAQCNTAFLRDVAESIGAAAADACIGGYAAFGPPQARSFFQQVLPAGIGLIEAWHPDFGDCLSGTVAALLERGHHHAVLLNSDSPTLPASLLVEAAHVLARPGDRVVLGPASDGGYYLLGLKRRHDRLFRDIAWSTPGVARETLQRAAELRLPVHLLPVWYDVDDAETLRMLASELFGGVAFALDLAPGAARHSRALIRSLIENADLRGRLGLTEAPPRAAE